MSALFRALLAATLGVMAPAIDSKAAPEQSKPTIILVHGAFADSSSWNGTSDLLAAEGYKVIAMANPLRGPRSDAAFLSELVSSIDGPVVLVGHSYGGAVISNADVPASRVKALVFVSAFAPDQGEWVGALAQKFPGSTLGEAFSKPVALAGAANDLYIDQAKFGAQFAADVPQAQSKLMAIAQRPIRDSAFAEPLERANWRNIPNWVIYGSADRNIPPALMAFMAERSKAEGVVVLEGASHVPMLSNPQAVAKLIIQASNGK